MIQISEKVSCCGCSACMNVCPKRCIMMIADSEGFLYPRVDENSCVNCHLCEKVCPVQNSTVSEHYEQIQESIDDWTDRVIKESKELPEAYAAYLNDTQIRENSTSGGFFTAVAKWVIAKGGVVYGVEVSKNCRIIHSSIDTVTELEKFRGSKYVQSTQIDTYNEIMSILNKERWVLYTGTPCQCAGLKQFLGKKDYPTLVVLDVFCHGVGSPKYWEKYVEFSKKKYKSDIESVRFREKTFGYNSACLAVYFKNGKSSHKDHDTDLYWTAFSKFYIFRPSCYDCHFKTLYHEYSDFSIGDFWNPTIAGKKFNKANGCSLVLVHSEKGRHIMSQLHGEVKIQQVNLKEALIVNAGPTPSKLISSSPKCLQRDAFFKDMDSMRIDKLVDNYIPLSLKRRVKGMVKPILYRTGLLYFLKKFFK